MLYPSRCAHDAQAHNRRHYYAGSHLYQEEWKEERQERMKNLEYLALLLMRACVDDWVSNQNRRVWTDCKSRHKS